MNKRLVDQRDPTFAEQSERISRETGSLASKVVKFEKENHYLRRISRVRPYLRIVLHAESAAYLLATWHCAGFLTGRDSAFVGGMSNDLFYAARALCVLANIHDGNRFTTDDPAVIERRLGDAIAYARRNPEAMIVNLPPSKRPKAFKS